MTVCPNCKKGIMREVTVRRLTFPAKVERYFQCSFCRYETETLIEPEKETEAQRLMREHLRDYHGVE